MKHHGACLCGKVSYEIEGEFEEFFLCHCSRCRKDTGSAFASNLFSSTAKLTWLSGEDKIRIFDYNSEGHIKSFCSVCGSALPNLQMDGKLIVVPAGCLDSEVTIEPKGHIFWASKASWEHDLESVPKFDELPDAQE